MDRFDRKPGIDALVETVLEAVTDLDRGATIPLSSIERLTGVERYTGHWHQIVKKLKRRFLEDRGIELWHVHEGEAYKLSTLHEQLVVNPGKRQKKVVRQHNKKVMALESLPADQLTPHQQTLRAAMIQSSIYGRRAAKRAAREQEALAKPRGTTNMYSRK